MIKEIQKPVEREVAQFHEQFEATLLSRSEWLGKAVEHLSASTGKMVRPIMTTLIAGLLRGDVPKLSITAGVLLELIHTATLIHDDVIDEAKIRRRRATLNAIFDNRVAVLMGDFVLSSALIGAIHTGNLRIIGIVSAIGRELTEGEIRQFETAEDAVLDEEIYMDVIRQKTAVLFRSCAEVAAISAEANEEEITRLGHFGELLGLAFQIRDDLFDYYSDDVGKPTGHDIAEGKVTLPLLHTLLQDGGKTQEGVECLELIRSKSYDEASITRLITFAHERGGIAYATERMNAIAEQARAILQDFPESDYRTALFSLIDFITQRSI